MLRCYLVDLYKCLKKKFLYLRFIFNFNQFRKLSKKRHFTLLWRDRNPCLNDKTSPSNFDRHYVYHTAWAARILVKTKPKLHIDVSSSLYFSSIVSAFIPIKFYDYRPADLNLSNLSSRKADLVSLPFKNDSISSLSCMHTVEHVGLGRYGDPLDPEGDLKAISEIKRVLAPRGSLLFVIPIGKPKIVFNAHRIYSCDQIIECFSNLKLEEFALIPDDPKDGDLIVNPSNKLLNKQSYGCGCFWFKKI